MITQAIILFVVCLLVVTTVKPNIICNEDGSLREFGVGFRKKTITPLWLVVLIIAILSYAMAPYLKF